MVMEMSIFCFVSDAMMSNMFSFHDMQYATAKSTDIYIIQLWTHTKQLNGQNLTTYWYSSLLQLLIILDDMILVLIGY
jgi:hypothetical protein